MSAIRHRRIIQDLVVELRRKLLQQLVAGGAKVLGEGDEIFGRDDGRFEVTRDCVFGGFPQTDRGFIEIVTVEILLCFLQVGLLYVAGNTGGGSALQADDQPIGMADADGAGELAEKS